MRRIVVIGDSHAGPYRSGWQRLRSRHPDIALEVFAAPVPHFYHLVLSPELTFGLPATAQGSRAAAVVEEVNGRPSIDLAGADSVIWAGYPTGIEDIAEILADNDVDGLRETDAARVMSASAFAEVSAAISRTRLPRAPWRGWQEPRLLLCARARPAEGCLASSDPTHDPDRRLADDPRGLDTALARYLDRFETDLASHGIGLLRQPPATISPEGLTYDTYSRGSERIKTGRKHRAEDHEHMNADYGIACIEALLAPVGADSVQPPV